MKINECLILAAGESKRLGLNVPKPLVKVVIGYKHKLILKEFEKFKNIEFIINKNYKKGIISSLFSAKNKIKSDRFLVVMGDTLIESEIIKRILKKNKVDGIILCVDKDLNKPEYRIRDSTKVLEKNGKIINIGKKIRKYNAIDVGVFIMPKEVFDIAKMFLSKKERTLSKIVKYFAKNDRAIICDVTGLKWIDIDYKRDLKIANKIIPYLI